MSDKTEDRLRATLAQLAQDFSSDRHNFDDVVLPVDEKREAKQTFRRRWTMPLVAAGAVAVLALGAIAVTRGNEPPPSAAPLPGTSTAVTETATDTSVDATSSQTRATSSASVDAPSSRASAVSSQSGPPAVEATGRILAATEGPPRPGQVPVGMPTDLAGEPLYTWHVGWAKNADLLVITYMSEARACGWIITDVQLVDGKVRLVVQASTNLHPTQSGVFCVTDPLRQWTVTVEPPPGITSAHPIDVVIGAEVFHLDARN